MRYENFVIDTCCANGMSCGTNKKNHNGWYIGSIWWWLSLEFIMGMWKIWSCFRTYCCNPKEKTNSTSDIFSFSCPAKFVWFYPEVVIVMLQLSIWFLNVSVSMLNTHASHYRVLHSKLCRWYYLTFHCYSYFLVSCVFAIFFYYSHTML